MYNKMNYFQYGGSVYEKNKAKPDYYTYPYSGFTADGVSCQRSCS